MPDFEGRFLWYELKTTDPESAKAFYSTVLDWAFLDASIPNLKYTRFLAGDTPVAGLTELSDRAKQAGVIPNWLGYVACPLVARTVDEAKQFGGYEHVPPTFIPGIGRFAVVTDPQRAEFGLLTRFGQPAYQPAGQDAKGQVGWHELRTADWPAAFEFYSVLFKWQKTGAVDLGEMGTYQLFAAGGITTVVNVNRGRNRQKGDGIEYLHLSFDDTERVPPAKFGQAITAIREHIRRGKVLVYCELGSSRSPVVVALYMHVIGYKNFDDALAELHELRPVVAPSDWMLECANTYLETI